MTVVAIIAGIYILLCLVFYFGQELFMFHPEKLSRDFKYKFPFPFREVFFDMEDGGVVNGIHFVVPNAKGVVFYVKGNSRSIKGWGKFARDFVSKGYDFFMVDYRGFGKSKGKRSESTIHNDLQHIYKKLTTQYDENNIVIYGRSIGSGFATRIASWNHPNKLILDSPYYSFTKQLKRYGFWLPINLLSRYSIRTDQFIKKVSCPIYIIHGTKDRLIPISASKKLAELMPLQTIHLPIKGAHHNNLPEFPKYHEQLYNALHDDELYSSLDINKIESAA